MNIKGKYGEAIVYTDDIEQEATSQIINLLNQPMAQGADVRIMPDVHAGAGCVIGYTAKLTDKIVPNLIGVDIGCGVAAWNIGKRHEVGDNFDKLDKTIRANIPSGRTIRDYIDWDTIESIYNKMNMKMSFDIFKKDVYDICARTNQNADYVWMSLGTLGGGNHFIEVDVDDNDSLWLIIHSGSRNFGLKTAVFHQTIAEESLLSISKEEFAARVEQIKKTKKGKGIEVAINALRKEASQKGKATGLEFLEGDDAKHYYADMKTAQIYAQLNRRMMAEKILDCRYKMAYVEPVESVHNYINFDDKIVRKGSISAHAGERVIIPLNMAEGCIVGTGQGNADWNFSAPHGAGRKMSRSKAKETIRLEDFQFKMKDVWTTSVGKDTIDEAPQAYKNADKVIGYLKETVDIECRMKPIYNFKASE